MKSSTKLLSGAVAAVAIGIAAAVFLNSKPGKKLKKELKAGLGDFYKVIAPRLKKMKKMGQSEYKEFMKTTAVQYGKAKKMAEPKIKELVKEAQDSWKYFTKHLGK